MNPPANILAPRPRRPLGPTLVAALASLAALAGLLALAFAGWPFFRLPGTLAILAAAAVVALLLLPARSWRSLGLAAIALGAAVVLMAMPFILADLARTLWPLMLTVTLWLAAPLLLAVLATRPRLTAPVLAALALALAGYWLGQLNSAQVSAIDADRSELLTQARQRQVQIERQASDEPAPESTNADAPDYRRAGRQSRDPAAQRGSPGSPGTPGNPGDRPDAPTRATLFKPASAMPEDQVILGNQLDRVLLFVSHLALFAAVAFAAIDYLLRFNRTVDPLFPLPLAGRPIDRLSPKSHATLLRPSAHVAMGPLLDSFLRRGESFLYLGHADPLDPARHRRAPLARLLPRGPGRIVNTGGLPVSAEFVCESLWFTRHCFCITQPADPAAIAQAILAFLHQRQVTRARAWRTVNLVWDLPSPPPPAILADLIALCRASNFRLIVASPDAPDTGFDEVLA